MLQFSSKLVFSLQDKPKILRIEKMWATFCFLSLLVITYIWLSFACLYVLSSISSANLLLGTAIHWIPSIRCNCIHSRVMRLRYHVSIPIVMLSYIVSPRPLISIIISRLKHNQKPFKSKRIYRFIETLVPEKHF